MKNSKPHVFIVDEDIDTVKNVGNFDNCVMKTYTDYKNLLLDVNLGKIKKHKIGFIHQNGSVSLATFLKNYLHGMQPDIKLMVYKNESELKNMLKLERLV